MNTLPGFGKCIYLFIFLVKFRQHSTMHNIDLSSHYSSFLFCICVCPNIVVIEVADGEYGELCDASADNVDMHLFCKRKWRRINIVPTTEAHSTMPLCAKIQRYSIMVR